METEGELGYGEEIKNRDRREKGREKGFCLGKGYEKSCWMKQIILGAIFFQLAKRHIADEKALQKLEKKE